MEGRRCRWLDHIRRTCAGGSWRRLEAGAMPGAAARRFAVGRSTAYRWAREARVEGRRAAKRVGGGPKPRISGEVEATWYRQVKLEGDGEAPKLARAANLCGSLGASDLSPDRERLRTDSSVVGGRKMIAVQVEEVVDLVVGGEEPLRLAG